MTDNNLDGINATLVRDKAVDVKQNLLIPANVI